MSKTGLFDEEIVGFFFLLTASNALLYTDSFSLLRMQYFARKSTAKQAHKGIKMWVTRLYNNKEHNNMNYDTFTAFIHLY